MEAVGILDVDSEVDIFVLHCVFLKLINKSLNNFAQAWNVHPLRTENHWSPNKIWLNSMIQAHEEPTPNEVSEEYGIDFDGPLPTNEVGTVVVPETITPLDDDELAEFMVIANHNCSNMLNDNIVTHYIFCKSHLNDFLSNHS